MHSWIRWWVAFWLVSLSLKGHAAALGEAERAYLLQGVEQVGKSGTPGPICVFGARAFPILVGKSGRDTLAPLAAGAYWGRGRVVVFGHTGYLNPDQPGDLGRLLRNSLMWTSGRMAGQRGGPRIGVRKATRLAAYLKGLNLRVTELNGANWTQQLDGIDVLAVGSHELNPTRDVPTLAAFIQKGGGLVTAGLGWGWKQLNPGRSLPQDHPGNVLLAHAAGLAFADGTLDGTDGGRFVANHPDLLETHALRALALVTGQAQGGNLAQASSVLILALRAIPSNERQFRSLLASVLQSPEARKLPRPDQPLGPRDGPARIYQVLQWEGLSATEPERMPAHPAAAFFPGNPPSDAGTVSRDVVVDYAVSGWHSTGLYAAPGALIRITAPAGAVGKKIGIRIGAHSDRNWHHAKWSRAPEISISQRLQGASDRIANPFGGLVYVEVPKGAGSGPASFRIEGAVPAPWFVLGRDTDADWNRTLRELPGPWAELQTDKVILTVPSAYVRGLENPHELMTLWDRVLDACADLATIPRDRPRPERIVADVQISAGLMHSGYPIMTHLPESRFTLDLARMKAGSWGHFHELGHNHQVSDWTFDGTTEVTCNLFTLYVYEAVCGIPSVGARDTLAKEAEQATVRRHLGTGADFNQWKAKPFLALAMYHQLKQEFGWEAFQQVFAEYRALPANERPRSDADRRDQWLVRFSRAVGKNLGPFFQGWGVPTSDAARASINGLPVWMPEGFPGKPGA